VTEQVIRPLAVGRPNWLHVAGDCGLQSTAVLLRDGANEAHRVNLWTYLRQVLTELPAHPAGADVTELLPDVWAMSRASSMSIAE
jgi:hypothetical protein